MGIMEEINGEQLDEFQRDKRNRMIEKIIRRLSDDSCCRKYPDWEKRTHELTYQKLCDRYHSLFGRDID